MTQVFSVRDVPIENEKRGYLGNFFIFEVQPSCATCFGFDAKDWQANGEGILQHVCSEIKAIGPHGKLGKETPEKARLSFQVDSRPGMRVPDHIVRTTDWRLFGGGQASGSEWSGVAMTLAEKRRINSAR
jgi:hypothetical protein